MEQKTFKIKFKDEVIDAGYVTSGITIGEVLDALIKLPVTYFGLDTETESLPEYKYISTAALNPHLSRIRLLQLYAEDTCFVIDMRAVYKSPGLKKLLRKFLAKHRFVAHNAVFDLSFLKHPDLAVTKIDMGCTMMLTRLIFHAYQPDDAGMKASLAALSEELLGVPMLKHNQASDWSVDDLLFEQIEYAALDAVAVRKLVPHLVKGMNKYKLRNYYDLLKKAMHPIVAMQLNGFGLDVEPYRELVVKWRAELYKAKKEVAAITGIEEITGHKLAEWLSTHLDKDTLALWPTTDTGILKTDSHVFADFNYLPIVKPFAEYQKRKTLTSSFGMAMLDRINPATGKLHSSFNLTGTRTGRMSCSSPNVQQMPRDEDVRTKFIPEKGYVFACADFSQIELRVAAEISQDKAMLKAYRDGVDLHALTASKISGKPINKISKEERRAAKAIRFGTLFGIGAKKLGHYVKKSYGIDITLEESRATMKALSVLYYGYSGWQQNQVDTCAQSLYVRTPTGKLRRLDPENTYGTSMNTPIQGGAAECMLNALILLYQRLNGLDAKLINCVHDEVIVQCTETYYPVVKKIIEDSMRDGFLAVFPKGITRGICECKMGKNWGEAK